MDKGHIEIARSLMKEIQYGNGMVNRREKERYPKKHLHNIASKCTFFDNNPDLLTNEHIFNITCGEEPESNRVI